MNMQRNTMAGSSRSGDSCGLKTRCAALLAALILAPTVHAQAEEPPPAKAWSVGSEKGGRLYSVSFEGGLIRYFKPLWTKAFTNDNFLITSSAELVELPAFQMRDMTLPELARSIAFLSQGALTVEVVERNDSLPGNIWRVARPSKEALSHAVKMRAVAAPRLFANEDTLARFLKDAETAQRTMREISYTLKKVENSTPLIGTEIMPLKGQRVFVLFGTEEGISGLESLIKAAEQTAAEPVKEAKSGK
jgi:malonyl CoA-acyl carrier protein transacylase